MTILNSDVTTSLGRMPGGEVVRVSIAVSAIPGSFTAALELYAAIGDKGMEKISDAQFWRTGASRPVLDYSISDGSTRADTLFSGAVLTVYLDMRLYRSFEFRAASSGNVACSLFDLASGPTLGMAGASIHGKFPPTFNFSGGSTRTYQSALSAWDEFTSARLVFANHNAAPATYDDHIVAVSSGAWRTGSFNIANPDSGTWSASQGPVVVPAAPGAVAGERIKQPALAVGPDIPIISLPRRAGELDGGTTPLLLARVKILSGNATAGVSDMGVTTTFPTDYDPVNEGISGILTAQAQNADYVTTPGGLTSSGARETTPGYVAVGALFTYAHRVTTVMAVGDSIMDGGSDGGSQRSPYLFKAVARLKAAGKRVAYVNASISGSDLTRTYARGKAMFDLIKPDLVIINSYTVNGLINQSLGGPANPLSTQAEWDAQWAACLEFARYVQAAGKQVVIVTPLPSVSISVAINDFRKKQLQRVVESGFPYINVEPLVDSFGKFKYASDTADGTHPLQPGHEKLAQLSYPVLDALIP